MESYKKANDQIHAPESLKKRVIEQEEGLSGRRARRSVLPRGLRFVLAAAGGLAVATLAAVFLLPSADGPKNNEGHLTRAYAIIEAAYPSCAPYPNEDDYMDKELDWDAYSAAYDAWRGERMERSGLAASCEGKLNAFTVATARTLLSGADGRNAVYSPVNVYLALAMLTELTDGNSRQQLLNLLSGEELPADGSPDASSLLLSEIRTTATNLWKSNYRDDGTGRTLLASSLWLNEDIPFQKSTLWTLAYRYYASSYQGNMASEELTRGLRAWLNEQTDGLLSESADGVSLDPETVLALATTVCFQAKWSDEFSKAKTKQETFHAPDGDVTCEFLHQDTSRTYYWSDRFSAVNLPFRDSGSMWLLLPDEGVDIDELLADDATMDFLFGSEEARAENSAYRIVRLAVPKFDVASEFDLTDGLKSLGVTDVFDWTKSDFSPLLAANAELPVALSSAQHAARVMIDEEGCTAVAYTVMAATGAGRPPTEEIDFRLDRPFLFCITGATSDAPLFLGVVNRP